MISIYVCRMIKHWLINNILSKQNYGLKKILMSKQTKKLEQNFYKHK